LHRSQWAGVRSNFTRFRTVPKLFYMDVSRPDALGQDFLGEAAAPEAAYEPRLSRATSRLFHSAAMIAGVAFAVLIAIGGGPVAVWAKTTSLFSLRQNEASLALISESDLDREKPQEQAEMLLQSALSRSGETSNQIAAQITAQSEVQIETQIESRIDAWRGKLQWDAQLGDLTTAALNSRDQSVRASAVEVQLAAYGLTKTESTVEALARQADSRDHQKKIWALWALGLLGNRGVDAARVVEVLAAQARTRTNHGNNEEARRWAVEGLALVGTTRTIAPLLEALRNDPSATVREHDACSLAASGMLSPEQRQIAVPQLINYSADPGLDAQTRAWTFQALSNITKQHLPNDSSAWKSWYQTSVARD